MLRFDQHINYLSKYGLVVTVLVLAYEDYACILRRLGPLLKRWQKNQITTRVNRTYNLKQKEKVKHERKSLPEKRSNNN